MARKTKQNLSPNSATSGATALGRISRRIRNQLRSAAQLRGLDVVHHHDPLRHPTAQGGRARVASTEAMTRMSDVTEVPKMVSSSSEKISAGIAISASTKRDRIWSSQPPRQRRPDCRGSEPTTKASAGGGKGDAHGVARAVDQPREHVAPDPVGAQRVFGAPGLELGADDLALGERGQHRGGDSYNGVDHDDEDAEGRGQAACRAPRHPPARSAWRARRRGRRRRWRRGRQAPSTTVRGRVHPPTSGAMRRGLVMVDITSAIRFSPTIGGGKDQRHRLHHGKVAVRHRIDHQLPEAGVDEHHLHHHDAGDQVGQGSAR